MKTEILTIAATDDGNAIRRAAELLDEGALVAIPTETVYGIGCKAGRGSFNRLDQVKGRHPDKRYTLHVGSMEQLEKYVPSMTARNRKLAQNAFPGPVTIVFELDDDSLALAEQNLPRDVFEVLYADQTLGVRYPDCPVSEAILATAESAIVAPSANPSGMNPATSSKEVLEYFDGKIECIVEIPGFETNLKQSSTVVKTGKRQLQILREGAIGADQIREWGTMRILFVCTGNTCRSPMAEGFCRKYFADNLGCQVDELDYFGYIIDSAGVAACENMPASRHAVEVCRSEQIDLSCHRSRQLTPEDIQQSDVIFTMSRYHYDSIISLFPSADDKCFMLDETADVLDPIGLGRAVYQNCFRQIRDNIIKRKKEIL